MDELRRVRLHLSPEARQDIERLKLKAEQHPGTRHEALYEAVVIQLSRLNGRREPTKELTYDSRFADLSDCDTTYVGADPNEKPPLRIVTIDTPSTDPSGHIERDVVVIGPRADSQVYHVAGQRLGRTPGVTLDELEDAAPRTPTDRTSREYQEQRERFESTYDRLVDVVDSWNPENPQVKERIDRWNRNLLLIDRSAHRSDELATTNPIVARRRIAALNTKMDLALAGVEPRAAASPSRIPTPEQSADPPSNDYEPEL